MKNFDEIGVSYFSNRHMGHFLDDLKSLKKDGFNAILHTFSEEDMLYSRGNIRDMVAAGKDNGFTVWIDPMGLGRVFGGESLSNFLLENIPAWQILSDGKKYPAACLNNPLFRKFVCSWIDSVISMGVDAIMWDEPRFAVRQKGAKKIWGCRCAYCRESYEIQNLKSMPLFKMDESVVNFRELSIKRFIAFMSSYAKERSGNRTKIAASFSVSVEKPFKNSVFESVANLKVVDTLGAYPCWFNAKDKVDIYELSLRSAAGIKEICDMAGKKPHFWLQGFGYRKGKEGQALQAINAAKDAGIRKLWVWGYNGGEMMSSIASDDPKKTWKTIVDGIKAK
jgi:hypothetical protein